MRIALLLLALFATTSSPGSPLFDDDSILEVTLTGPISTLLKHHRNREEFPFTLTVDNTPIDVVVRVRGHSRVEVCSFTPLRLNFSKSGPDGSVFEGENKLKLVTHCKNGDDKAQDSVLNEYTAYRLLNLITDRSYRVRPLRIQYHDTDEKQRKLDEPHYGFLIESDDGLAKRLNGTVTEIDAIQFSNLDMQQTARLSVFQYLIGNQDWSFVKSENDDSCCHNIDLLTVNNLLVPIPYDFDLAAVTRANYRSNGKLNQSSRRNYSGYCKTPIDKLEEATDQVQASKDEILAATRAVPAIDDDALERRVKFVARYFEEAAKKDSLLTNFKRNCIGKR